ncbi:sigma-70 family RNA polymerase sigma factor [Caballeronia sp. LZ028]|uniref:RNA polymerase sigma factor n=1 Tax=Caballeronia sp. LZ028 TaxID=3038563 RepID=UPI002864F63D|nr:sigma-70 family RNA polymerase sigma factor [Caballeronia sp. LZ028]MDR5770019.1 sigma-70 family RNA polymerase sigma factor [Caballeronia sp. LZ028]
MFGDASTRAHGRRLHKPSQMIIIRISLLDILVQPAQSLVHAFSMHYRALLAFARRRVRSAEMASDLVHDVFVKVAQLQTSETVRQPQAFFARMIDNLLIDRVRHARTAGRHVVGALSGHNDDDRVDEHIVDSVGPCQLLEASQTAAALDHAISALPARCRETFLLRKVEGLSHEAIAERLGISKNMVEKHLRRALVSLVEFESAGRAAAIDLHEDDVS